MCQLDITGFYSQIVELYICFFIYYVLVELMLVWIWGLFFLPVLENYCFNWIDANLHI